MPSELKVDKLSPYAGTTLTIGDAGDTISFASGVLPALESLTITGDLTVDTTTFKVDSTNDLVGVGGVSTVGGGSTNGQILFSIPTSNRALTIKTDNDGAKFDVGTTNTNLGKDLIFASGGTEIARFTSAGLAIGGTGAANTLDDYEEGTWTPTVSLGTVTVVGASYTKVGRLVTISFTLSTFSDTTSASNLTITGLPFTSASGDNFDGAGSVMFRYVNTLGDGLTTFVNDNVSSMNIYKNQATGNYTTVKHSDLNNASHRFIITHTYQAA